MEVGSLLRKRQWRDKDLKKAMKLYELSAKQGNADAKRQIAVAKRKLDEHNNGRSAKRQNFNLIPLVILHR